jgi:hypothetical protein
VRGKPDDDDEWPVVYAIRADPRLTSKQRTALLEVYDAFTGRRRRKAS